MEVSLQPRVVEKIIIRPDTQIVRVISAIGIEGDKGDVGDRGKSAYEVAVEEGFVGTEAEWLASLEGPQGDPGPAAPGLPPEAFGAVGDGVTDDAVALQLWLDAGGKLYLPPNAYRSSARLIVRKCVLLSGASYGFDNRLAATPDQMPGSRLVFDAGVSGLDVQPQTTLTDPDAVAAAGSGAFVQEGAYNSRFEDIALLGAVGVDATGFYSRTLIHAKNVHVEGFSGKGFDVSATLTTDPTAEYGNASTSTLTACVASTNGSHGFHLRGKDANACSLIGCNAISNGGWGILDESLLGNAYDGCHVANNTLGSVKNVGGVSNSSFIGLYIEPDVHQASDISYRCVVHGGQGADIVRQYNIGTNGHPTITTGIATTGLLTFHPGDYTGASGAAIADTAVVYRSPSRGLTLQGAGATYDLTGVNSANTAVWGIVAGTTVTRFLGSVQILNNNVYFNDVSGFPGPFGGPGNGAAYATTVTGLTLTGRGSTYDVGLLNQAGAVALGVAAGTTNVVVAGSLTASKFFASGGGTPVALQALPLTFNFTAAGDAYFYADEAMTLTQQATLLAGTISYQKSTAAAPSTFSATTSPVEIEAGAWLKVSASAAAVVHLKRTA